MFLFFSSIAPDTPPQDESEIQRLVARAQTGDEAALVALYREHVDRLHRAVRPLCLSDAEAEDVVQDSFVKAFDALGRYQRRGRTRFVSWLLTIARNTALKSARRRRFDPLETVTLVSDQPSPETQVERDQTKAALLAALNTLSERDREVVSLFYGAELTASEVAEIVGVTEANVRKICQRSREDLKTKIDAALRERSSDVPADARPRSDV